MTGKIMPLRERDTSTVSPASGMGPVARHDLGTT
jgi:hypothetical protein